MTGKIFGHSQLPPLERQTKGKELRNKVPRSSHNDWSPAADRPDPLDLLQAQDQDRLQHLLPIKYGRMLASPFAFLRGSAVVMASDLAGSPVMGQNVLLCGDAHLSNFGVFATPERKLVFDINDFDETYPGPWEWDLKRLAASAVLAGRENGFKGKICRQLALAVSRSYRESMRRFSQASILNIWYYQVEANSVLKVFDKYARQSSKSAQKTIKKARAHTRQRTLKKLTQVIDGKRQLVNDPPLLQRFSDVTDEEQKQRVNNLDVESAWFGYVNSLSVERRRLLDRFRISDAALRVGGVGSVGTRTFIALLEGDTDEDAIILQQKQAGPSALEAYLPKRDFASQAQRVVIGQHLMQAAADIFLGWHHAAGISLDFYWRQLKDMKASFDLANLDESGLETYLKVCGVCLARAHARTGDAAAISGYLGSGDVFDKAISNFAEFYANQTENDHQALVDAVQSGRIAAQTGI
jgi:uncharacterized protein (DUF2252 family)